MATNEGPQKRHPAELKERAVRMVLELRREDPGDHSVIRRVARQLAVSDESLLGRTAWRRVIATRGNAIETESDYSVSTENG
jgi:transposase-like protein